MNNDANKPKIRTLIVDDEPLALRGLSLRLDPFEDVEIIDQSHNGRDAIKKIRSLKPDLVFLDIQMPGFDGFDVIKALIPDECPIIVFVTAYDEYAVQAFQSHALDYLLKPVEEDRLSQTLERVRAQLRQQAALDQNNKLLDLVYELDGVDTEKISDIIDQTTQNSDAAYESHINVKDRGQITRVPVENIEWIDAAGDYMCLHENTPDGHKTHILRETMKSMEKRLDPKLFERIHRSTIVNISRIDSLKSDTSGKYTVVLHSNKELPVSRNYKKILARFL